MCSAVEYGQGEKESGRGRSTKVLLEPHDIRNTESSTGTEKKPGLLVACVQQIERGIWHQW